jgi:WD40 repeat protein
MTEPRESPKPFRFHVSLRVYMCLVGVVGVVVGLQYRREPLRPATVKNLTQVGKIPSTDIFRIAWSRDRDRMAVIGWEKPVEIRDPISLGLIETIGEGKKIIDFDFSPRKEIVAYTENGPSNTAIIFDQGSGTTRTLKTGNSQPDVVFNHDGTLLATGGYGTVVKLWSVSDGVLVREFDAGPIQGGLTPRFSPDGKILAVGNRNGYPLLFETATGKRLRELGGQYTQEIQFHPDGKTIAVTRVDGSIAICRVSDGKMLAERFTKAKELYTVDWSPYGAILASAGLEGKITLWDPKDLTILRELDAPRWVIRVRFSPDGLNLHYAGGDAGMGGSHHLAVLGIEGSLYSLLHRPRK